jgi:hypothetical protein
LNSLYSDTCPGYAQAYFDQQCSLNGLYDRTCPNYAEAYAKANIINVEPMSASETLATNQSSTDQSSILDAMSDISSTVSIANPNPESTTTVATASPANVSSPVQLTTPVTVSEVTNNVSSKSTTSSTTSSSTSQNTSQENREQKPTTTRQKLAERRLEAARKAAIQSSISTSSSSTGDNTSSVSGQLGEVDSMEAQKELQNVVIGAMGFVPGFDIYSSSKIPDVQFYKPFEIYKGNTNVDNQRMLRDWDGRRP